MIKAIFLSFVALIFSIPGISQSCQFKYNYNFSRHVNPLLFYELKKDLGYPIVFPNTTEEFTYIQYLKNQNYYIELLRQIDDIAKRVSEDSLYSAFYQVKTLFPYQSYMYYSLSRYYLDRGNYSQALSIIEEAFFDYDIAASRFCSLKNLYSQHQEFVSALEKLEKEYQNNPTHNQPDSSLIAIVDSISYYDQLDRFALRLEPEHPRRIRQIEIDSINAKVFKSLVKEMGWLAKHLGPHYPTLKLAAAVMHWAAHEQFFFLNYIISDCKAYKAPWRNAELVAWKLSARRLTKNRFDYHQVPLVYFDTLSSSLDIKDSMLGISSFVEAMLDNEELESEPITLIATSKHPEGNLLKNMERLKRYFIILGFDENQISIQNQRLDSQIEEELPFSSAFVVKRFNRYGSN